jgi:hypothetical protein
MTDLRAWVISALILTGGMASVASAQVVAGGDFDICDNCGTLSGNTARLVARAGAGSPPVNRGVFHLVNAANADQDVDNDGYTPGVDFNNLVVADTSDFVNPANPAQVILRQNFVVSDFLNPLRNGFANQVTFYVNVPDGTPAGLYQGRFVVVDQVLGIGANANNEALRTDFVFVEIEVTPDRGFGLVRADTAAELDSLTLRGRPGQTVSGVTRIANLGNVALENVRLEATDLVATSGTGLRIRNERITFSPTTVTSVGIGDTTRITVTVRIPEGILAGEYRGDLVAQAEGIDEQRIPLTVVVTTPGDIVFEENPVVGREGDNAVIIFNADPGSTWELRIFDMMALTVFGQGGRVFPGSEGGNGTIGFAGDQAVRFTWPLVNGRGENVAGGMYYVVVNAIQDGRARQLRGKLMVIR